MSVSFVEYRKEMLDAYESVMDEKDDTDWALYSYKANNELYLESTGDEGLDELESEFNNGKIQYAFVRINDPNTKMKKYLLIVWQGEGVPATTKGAAANHVRDVKRFFKAHHLTIFARNDDDVTPEEIMRQVMKATSNFSFVQPTSDVSNTKPVGSVYKPVRPIEEIKKVKKESFWEKIQAEEESRKKDDVKQQRERQKLEEERLKEEQQRSEKKRKEVEKKRELDIIDQMKAQKLADDNKDEKLAEKAAWQEQLKEQERSMENQRRNRRTSSVEHTQEAERMITSRTNNPRAMWAQREKEQKENRRNERVAPPSRKLSNSFGNRFNQQQHEVPATPAPTPVTPTLPPVPVVPEPVPVEDDNAFEEPPQPTYEDITSYQQQQPAAAANVFDEATPQVYNVAQDDYAQQQEAVYGEPEEQPVYDEATTPAVDQPVYEEAGDVYDVAADQYNEQTNGQQEGYYQDDTTAPQAAAAATQQLSECRVRALYDYQAVDDSEISFDPDDVITQVEQIDEGWWRGIAPNGSYGLFPANYVEIM